MLDLRLTVRVLALAFVAGAMVPATAAADAIPPGVMQTATTQSVPGSGPRSTHALECAAIGTSEVISLEITACYLLGADGRMYRATGPAHPGPVAARVGAFLDAPRQPYAACVATRAVYLDGSTAEGVACFG